MKKLVAFAAVCSLFTQFKAPSSNKAEKKGLVKSEETPPVSGPLTASQPSEDEEEVKDMRFLNVSCQYPEYIRDLRAGRFKWVAIFIEQEMPKRPLNLDHPPDLELLEFLYANNYFTGHGITVAKRLLTQREEFEKRMKEDNRRYREYKKAKALKEKQENA